MISGSGSASHAERIDSISLTKPAMLLPAFPLKVLAQAACQSEMPRLAAKKGARMIIGFAAETDDLEANARAKLKRKGLDLIVANDVTREGAGFEVDTNIVTLIGSDGSSQSHPQMSKDAVADLILDRIVALRAAKPKSGRADKPSRLRAVR